MTESFDKFNDALSNGYVSSVHSQIPRVSGQPQGVLGNTGFAVDSQGVFYVGERIGIFRTLLVPGRVLKYRRTARGRFWTEKMCLAVDFSSDDAYVDHETSIAAYGPSHNPVERFGSPQLQASEGVAVDSATGTVYATDTATGEVDVFTSFIVPDVTTGAASAFTETSVTVAGVVNPDGLPVTSCVFEYGTSESDGQSEPCSPAPGSGSGPVAVSAQLKGLEPLTEYHFRLKVSNANGSNQGQDHTFVAPQPVGVSEEAVSDVSSTSALFGALVDPGGADTTYHFEYGPTTAYGQSVPAPEGDLGSTTVGVPVAVRAQGLLAGSVYHVRVVASNVLGTVFGPDLLFTDAAGRRGVRASRWP